jgi:hypothetical protein
MSGSFGLCKPSEMGTKDTKTASIQMAPIVTTATYRVTHRVYLEFYKEKRALLPINGTERNLLGDIKLLASVGRDNEECLLDVRNDV